MRLNTDNPTQGVIDAAEAVSDVAWGLDDPLTVSRDAEVILPAGILLDLRWALNYLHNRTEAEHLGVPGPEVEEHPEGHEGPCFCQECLEPR